MLAAIIVSGFLHAHNLKEQKKVEHKKQIFECVKMTIKDSSTNEEWHTSVPRKPYIIKCENDDVVCYLVGFENSISCIPNPKNQQNIK